MPKYLKVTGDTNDADYVTEMNKISDGDLEKLMPLFKAIKNFKPYTVKIDDSSGTGRKMSWGHDNNFPYGDGDYVPRKDLGEKEPEEIYADHKEAVELFTEGGYCPYNIHTIESIEVLDIEKVKKIL